MNEIRRKYLMGWLTSKQMKEEGINHHSAWTESAEEAEKDNSSLVVFKIPNDKSGIFDTETIREIETFLQEKFSDK